MVCTRCLGRGREAGWRGGGYTGDTTFVPISSDKDAAPSTTLHRKALCRGTPSGRLLPTALLRADLAAPLDLSSREVAFPAPPSVGGGARQPLTWEPSGSGASGCFQLRCHSGRQRPRRDRPATAPHSHVCSESSPCTGKMAAPISVPSLPSGPHTDSGLGAAGLGSGPPKAWIVGALGRHFPGFSAVEGAP